MRKTLLSTLATVAILSGCSTFQPHQLSVEPLSPTVTHQSTLPDSLEIQVESQDLRSSGLIGFRISRLSDRAEVSLPLPAAEALKEGARVAIVKLGATPTPLADTRLTIILQELEYQARQSALQKVSLTAAIRVNVEKYDQSYSGSYSTEKEHQFATTPSLADNQRIVNEILQLTLSRAFNDPDLIRFLRQP